MKGRIFVDTNILVYAHDLDAAQKHHAASQILTSLWDQKIGALSTQVLQEFYVVATKKMAAPMTLLDARTVVKAYLPWSIGTDGAMVLQASEIQERNRISFWDAMIVAAAHRAGAVRLLTEDLNHGRVIEGITVENPFIATEILNPNI
jgi:predicted nucleic acid-binding protein